MEKALDESDLLGEGLEEKNHTETVLLKLPCVYGLSLQGTLLKRQILVQQVCSGCQMVPPLLLAHKPHFEKLEAGISNANSIEAWCYLDFFLHKVINTLQNIITHSPY